MCDMSMSRQLGVRSPGTTKGVFANSLVLIGAPGFLIGQMECLGLIHSSILGKRDDVLRL